MKISYNWLKNISLMFFLILLPLENICASICFRNPSDFYLFRFLAPITAFLFFAILILILRSQIKSNILFKIIVFLFLGGLSLSTNLDKIVMLLIFISLNILTFIALYVFKLLGGVSLRLARNLTITFIFMLIFMFFAGAEPIEKLFLSAKCNIVNGDLKKNSCGYFYCEQ